MIINSLKMVNFLSHENTEINFENGVNIITGKNGAGKSSILDAMKFALFAESRNNERNNDLIKKGKKFFDIWLSFNISGDKYEVYRHFGIKNAKNADRLAFVKKNDIIVAETYEGVNSEITKILNVSKDVFKNSVFVEQGQMDSLITGTPKERKTVLSDIIGLTSLSKNADKLKEITGRFRNESMLLQDSVSTRERLLKENKDLESNNNIYLKEVSELNMELDKHKKIMEEIEEKLIKRNTLINSKQQKNEIKSDYVQALNKRINEKSSLNVEINSINNKLKKLEEIESNNYYKNRDLFTEYFNSYDRIEEIKGQLASNNESIKRYEDSVSAMKPLEEKKKEYDYAISKRNENSLNIKKYHDDYNNYIAVDSKKKNIAEQIKSRKDFIDNILKKYNITPEDLNNLRERKNNLSEEIQKIRDNIASLKASVGELNRNMSENNENINTLSGKNKCPLCGTELTELHRNDVINEYKSKNSAMVDKIEHIKIEKEDFENNIKKLQEAYSRLDSRDIDTAASYNNEMGNLNDEFKSAENDVARYVTGHEYYIKILDENENLDKKLSELKPSIDLYNKYAGIANSLDITGLKASEKRLLDIINDEIGKLKSIETETGIKPDRKEFIEAKKLSNEAGILNQEKEKMSGFVAKLKLIDNEISERNEYIKNLDSKILNINKELENYNDIDKTGENEKLEIEKYSNKRVELNTLIESGKERIDKNFEKLEELKNDINKYNKLKNVILKLEKIREAFDYNGIQGMIRKDGSVSITNMTRKYLQSFNLDFDDISVDENFDITVTQNSMEQGIESLSGGEKTALAIALRIAVANYVLDRISTMIMDEPTNFLDEDRRNNLKDIIQYSLKGENIIPQMIMITHHSELSSVADVSFEVSKHGGTSTVTYS